MGIFIPKPVKSQTAALEGPAAPEAPVVTEPSRPTTTRRIGDVELPHPESLTEACPAPNSKAFLTQLLGKMEEGLDRIAAHPTGHDAMPLLGMTLQCGAAISSMLPVLGMGLDPDARLGMRHMLQRATAQIFILVSHAQTRTKEFTEAMVGAGVLSKEEAAAACHPLLREEALAAKRLTAKIEDYRSTFLGKLSNVLAPRSSVTDLVTDLSILHMTHDSLMTLYDTILSALKASQQDSSSSSSSITRNALRDQAAAILMRCDAQRAALKSTSVSKQEQALPPNSGHSGLSEFSEMLDEVEL